MFLEFLNTQIYLLFIIIILLISEIFKMNNNFADAILSLISINSKIPKKYIFSFAVTILGILPIPGRIILINFLLDSISNKNNNLGTLAYISTHHYYLWSPIETSVIISLGILHISYLKFLSYMFLPLLCYIIFFILYIIFIIKESDFKNIIQTKNIKHYYSTFLDIGIFLLMVIISIFSNEKLITCYFFIVLVFLIIKYKISIKEIFLKLDHKFIISIFIILYIGFIIKNSSFLKELLRNIATSSLSLPLIFLICFFLSFLFGSSSKYSTIAANTTLILGIQFFPLLYIVDYCGYILSPVHKCTFFIFSYFKFKFRFIFWLIILSLVVFIPTLILFIFNI
jgi:hypothetical protein